MNFEKSTEQKKRVCVICCGICSPTSKGKTCSYWCSRELNKQTVKRRTKYSAIEKIVKQSQVKQ